MLATAPCQFNTIDFKALSVASEGNYITNKLNLLKWLLQPQKDMLSETSY